MQSGVTLMNFKVFGNVTNTVKIENLIESISSQCKLIKTKGENRKLSNVLTPWKTASTQLCFMPAGCKLAKKRISLIRKLCG